MRTLSDIQLRILKEEFPATSHSGDEDIERYFELRKIGQQAKALALYNGRIRRKYPDPARRELLMRYYRSRDPRYGELYRDSLADLADRLITRSYGILDTLTRDIDSVDLKDAYSVIKLAEGLLSVISPDRDVAIAFTERYARYARLLSYRERQARDTAELIRLYVTDTIESVEELKKEREERRKERARSHVRSSRDAARPSFDLSRVTFSPEEVDKITIPATITRTEDVVIAYCVKYWGAVNDPAFEKAVFLYSRKYHTRHNEIFQAIKNGVTHGWKDEEILNAVLANVVTGYYYSISGDRYLQTTWARYRASSEPVRAAPSLTFLPVKTERARRGAALRRNVGDARKKIARPKVLPRREKEPPLSRKDTQAKSVARTVPNTFRAESPRESFVPNSVSDMIRKLTGKSYAVYKDLFFQNIRPSLRAILADAGGKDTPFSTRQNSAEQLIYDYLFSHWNDPYQQWEKSAEREKTRSLGYRIDGLEPIIARWIKDSNERDAS